MDWSKSSRTRMAGGNSLLTQLAVGNVPRASSTVTVARQRDLWGGGVFVSSYVKESIRILMYKNNAFYALLFYLNSTQYFTNPLCEDEFNSR